MIDILYFFFGAAIATLIRFIIDAERDGIFDRDLVQSLPVARTVRKQRARLRQELRKSLVRRMR